MLHGERYGLRAVLQWEYGVPVAYLTWRKILPTIGEDVGVGKGDMLLLLVVPFEIMYCVIGSTYDIGGLGWLRTVISFAVSGTGTGIWPFWRRTLGSVWAAKACSWASWNSGEVMGVWEGVGRVWVITSLSWEGSGTLTSVIGTASVGPDCCTFMKVVILSVTGITVISSPDSTEKVLSRVMAAGGGLFSGGGMGLPYSSSVSLWTILQWSANRVKSWKTSPQCLHLWILSLRWAWMCARR